MRREYRNFNNTKSGLVSWNNLGKASCLLLLLLTFLVVNPVVGSAVFAEGDAIASDNSYSHVDEDYTTEELVSGNAITNGNTVAYDGFTDDGDNNDLDDGATYSSNPAISVAAEASSGVTISFGTTSGSSSLTPTGTTGAKTKVNTPVTITVKDSDGYDVYVHGDSTQLKNSSNSGSSNNSNDSNYAIDTLTTNTTYTAIPENRWGYALIKKTSSTDTTVADTTTYKAMPSAKGTADYSNANKGITSETSYFMLSFAANIGSDKPAGTYINGVTLSVVSTPKQVTLMEITNMQEMTSDICSASALEQQKQLKDTRDGKYYWVAKLADGKCWMTQNLALDLATTLNTSSTIKTFTDTDTDLNSKTSWKPSSTTYSTINSYSKLENNTGQRSWNLGSYYHPSTASSCSGGKQDLADCSHFRTLTTPTSANNDTNAHWLAGNYYQWCAATAGCNLSNGEAADSICPKGWRLPTSNTNGEFQTLMNQYNLTSGTSTSGNATSLLASPLYFVRAGLVSQGTNWLDYAGSYGRYWSSAPGSNYDYAYYFTFAGASFIDPSGNTIREFGFFVRCLAR